MSSRGRRSSDGGGSSPSNGDDNNNGNNGNAPSTSGKEKPSSSVSFPPFDENLHEASAEAFSSSCSISSSSPFASRRSRPRTLPPLLALDNNVVLRHEARKLLSSSPTWKEHDFSRAWREALARVGVGSGFGFGEENGDGVVDLDLAAATRTGGALAGLATLLEPPPRSNKSAIVSSSVPGGSSSAFDDRMNRVVLRLDAAVLPRDPRSRFLALFAAKPRWTREEIAPYLLGAAVAPGTAGGMGALLLAHARASQAEPDAPVFFSAR